MKKAIYIIAVLLFLVLTGKTYAQPAVDIKTEQPTETQPAQPTSRLQKPSPVPQVRTQPTTTPQTKQSQPDSSFSQDIQSLQNRISNLENQTKKDNLNPQIASWLAWWWRIGFLSGVLLLFLWVFVGWQWTHFKFWGFGWPWPWWFWIPLFWFIPWLIIGWQWWLVWWVWWIPIWWLFPWIFWLFWWVIVFKELIISLWHRRGPPYKETLSP